MRADQVEGSPLPSTQPTRRRTSLFAVIGLLFRLGFGLGISLGIIIITKRRITTTIEVPEGKNVQVNEKGDLTVDFGNAEKTSTGPATQTANEAKKPNQAVQRLTADGKIVPDSYRLAPGDILGIFNDRGGRGAGHRERLGDGIEISNTGIAYLGPYYGELKLQALSLDEAERMIENKLQEDINKYNPEVSIRVLDKEDQSKQAQTSGFLSHFI